MKAIVDKADATDPKLNDAFREYAQARGFAVDPTRVRSPRDKGLVSYCTSWCWLGGNSSFEVAALAFDEAGIAGDGRVEEPGVAVVGLVAGEQAGTVPGLDGAVVHAEVLGDLGDGELAVGAEPVGVGWAAGGSGVAPRRCGR